MVLKHRQILEYSAILDTQTPVKARNTKVFNEQDALWYRKFSLVIRGIEFKLLKNIV